MKDMFALSNIMLIPGVEAYLHSELANHSASSVPFKDDEKANLEKRTSRYIIHKETAISRPTKII